ncbi:hypothetical protein GCM10009850_079800 [Nonomuraea monospora]|uniref:Uncharacterized protein n=1 Tax=Nonomuraea monospora TaxID=568818 RepID=A0ABN3CST8_9ACTN
MCRGNIADSHVVAPGTTHQPDHDGADPAPFPAVIPAAAAPATARSELAGQAAGPADPHGHGDVHEAADVGWELDALNAPACPEGGIRLSVHAGCRDTSYVNGQHKGQALLDAGVRRTLVVDWVTLPPKGG